MCRYAGVQEGAFDDIQQVSCLLQQGMIYCTLYIPDVHQNTLREYSDNHNY